MLNLTYSFLSKSDDAVTSFISDALPHMEDGDVSNHVKSIVYQENFPSIEARDKYTGFEKVSHIDAAVRAKLKVAINEPDQITSMVSVPVPDKNNLTTSFKESLIATAEAYRDQYNILYLSGGVDSEVVALAFIEAKVSFVPVIFMWSMSDGEIINHHDTKWAFKFCKTHNLKPYIKVIDIETLWASDQMEELAKQYNTSSPQILTYHYGVNLIDEDFQSKLIFKSDKK